MSLNIYKNVMMKAPSAPMPSYIFKVNFRYSLNDGTKNELGFDLTNESDRSMWAIKCDLPSLETHIKTFKYFGSQKSYPVIRTHSGDSSLEFYIHSDPHENNFIVYNFFKKFNDIFQYILLIMIVIIDLASLTAFFRFFCFRIFLFREV